MFDSSSSHQENLKINSRPEATGMENKRTLLKQTSLHLLGTRKRKCGKCDGCVMETCGMCNNCKDMRKYGGPGKKKKGCSRKTCTGVISNSENISNLANIGSTD